MFDKEKYWENRKAGIRGQGVFNPAVRFLTWTEHLKEVKQKQSQPLK